MSRGQSWLFEPQSGDPTRSPAEGQFIALEKSWVALTQAQGVGGEQEQEQGPNVGPHGSCVSLWSIKVQTKPCSLRIIWEV